MTKGKTKVEKQVEYCEQCDKELDKKMNKEWTKLGYCCYECFQKGDDL